MDQIPLIEKYRPRTLSDIQGNEKIIACLKKCKSLPNLLLYGPPGTGKTTTIHAIANSIYGKYFHQNVLELNASNERGINTIRERVKTFSYTKSFTNQRKLVILDESDALSRDAQNALRRIIEDFSENTRFCLICNFSSKIIPAIQSRFCKFRYMPIKFHILEKILKNISEKENIKIENPNFIIENAKGDLRTLINTIDGLSNINLQKNLINNFIDLDFHKILSSCKKDPKKSVFLILEILQDVDFLTFFDKLVTFLRNQNKFNFQVLADIENRISIGCNENIQIRCLVGILGSLENISE